MTQKVFVYILLLTSFYSFSFQKEEKSLQFILEKNQITFNSSNYKEVINTIGNYYIAKNQFDSLTIAKLYQLKASAYYGLANFTKAISFYNLALQIAPNSNEGQNLKGTALFDKSYAEYELKEYVLSYKTVKKAEYVLSKIPTPNYNYLLSIYIDLGSEASYLGFYDEAEYYLKKGFDIFKKKLKSIENKTANQASNEVLFQYKFIYLYGLKGDENKALFHLSVLENLKKKNQFNAIEKLMYAASLNCIGDLYLNFRERYAQKQPLKKGAFFINKAINQIDKEKYKDNYIQFKFNQAKQLRYSKNYKEALLLNDTILKMAGEKDKRYPFFLAQKGMIFLDNGNSTKALEIFHKMISFIHSDTLKLKNNFANFNPSSNLNHTGLLVEIADEIYIKHPKDSVVLEQISNFYKIGLQQLKNCYQHENFNKKIKDYYHKAIQGILKTKEAGFSNIALKNVINDIEIIENKFAWKEFVQNRNFINSTIPDSIFNKETVIRNQLVTARKNNDNKLILDLNNQLEKHITFLNEKYPTIAKYVYSDFAIDQFQKSLDKNTVVFRYKKIADILYVFKITKTEISIKSIQFTDAVQQQIKMYLNTLKSLKTDQFLAAQLATILLPFEYNKAKNIIIIPDDLLHHLPFETLQKNNHYLIEKHTISYASYLVFINQNSTIPDVNRVYITAPSYNTSTKLNGAAKEANLIASIFEMSEIKSVNATKNHFINNAQNYSLIHLAAHAKIDNEKPELSYFVFTEDKQKNNKLYVEELYGLQLKANLAVLSACNTGTPFVDENLGAISIQRAFTLAGVPATISSLWEVPDEITQQLMVSFYTFLKQGKSTSEALQQAKLNYLKSNTDKNLLAPYYWAGFVVSGDVSPLFNTTDFTMYWTLLAIILVLIIGILLYRFQKR